MIVNAGYRHNVPCGLRNLGNTCYLNACIQVMMKMPEIERDIRLAVACPAVVAVAAAGGSPESGVVIEYGSMLQRYRQEERALASRNGSSGTLSPHLFFLALERAKIVTRGVQCDMSECFAQIIEAMKTSLSRKVTVKIGAHRGAVLSDTDRLAQKCFEMRKVNYESGKYCELAETFSGVVVTEVLNRDPRARAEHDDDHDGSAVLLASRAEDFFILPLLVTSSSAAKRVSLSACIALVLQPEVLENENAWFNDATQQKEERVWKRTRFWKFPEVLCLSLQRMALVPGGSPSRNGRDAVHVEVPKTLDLSGYVSGYHAETYVYDLFAMCNHYGTSSESGHYCTIVWDDGFQRWLFYDDEHVCVISEEDVFAKQGSTVYCVFYRKKVISTL